MHRRTFIKQTGLSAGIISTVPLSASSLFRDEDTFPLIDLHVHRADGFGMDQIMKIANERKVTFGIVDHPAPWPLFLPVCIARDYYKLWTDDRMQQLITAAKKRNIAFEINDMSHTPHERFISMAKEQGLKFTFGSDSRNNNAGRLSYAAIVAKKCNLQTSDFFIPPRKISVLTSEYQVDKRKECKPPWHVD